MNILNAQIISADGVIKIKVTGVGPYIHTDVQLLPGRINFLKNVKK